MKAPAPRENGRRALHLASGLLGLLAAFGPLRLVTPVLGCLAALAVALEAARLASPAVGHRVDVVAGRWFRPSERRAVSGAATLAVSYLVVWLLFPPLVAARAMVVTAVCDPAAAAVGSRFSGSPGHKSWTGTAAAFGAALLVLLMWRTFPLGAAYAAIAAAVAERVAWSGADNLAIPLATAAVLSVVS